MNASSAHIPVSINLNSNTTNTTPNKFYNTFNSNNFNFNHPDSKFITFPPPPASSASTPPLPSPIPLPALPRPILCLQDTRTIDTLLDTSVNYPKPLELYLNYEIRTLLNVILDVLKHVSITERIHYLTRLFFKYPIIFDELNIVCLICICKLDFHWLPQSEQIIIKKSQKIGYKKIEEENVNENRLSELITLSEHCLNIFNALIKLP